MAGLRAWVKELHHSSAMVYDCLDIFGASERIKFTWINAGYKASAFDVKLSPDHDLTAEVGFKTLVELGLGLLGLIFLQIAHV